MFIPAQTQTQADPMLVLTTVDILTISSTLQEEEGT